MFWLQIEMEIYFYSIKEVPPNTELLVWYCRDYALRLNYPPSCDYNNMSQKISKYMK